MSCPQCAKELDCYSNQDGGWCGDCQEWFPPDIVEERMQENE